MSRSPTSSRYRSPIRVTSLERCRASFEGRCNSSTVFKHLSKKERKQDLSFCSIHSCFLCKTHTPAGFQDRRAGREHGSGSVICCASCGNVYLHAKLRTVLFFLFCMRATPLLLKLQSLQTSLQSCPSHLLHRVISFVLLCYSRCGRSFFCIHFLSPQAAEALQVAAREAREVSLAITCVEPRSPHAQAARMVSRTNRHF